ncbi:MAG TPA: hypothetical protein VHX13_03415 [Acidobacteriaceae bacterium]|jgi:hypothetical protein|nr:hypothetical protein [Acidobacteriaceae bacterium]
MRTQIRKFAPVFGALVVSLALAPVAGAQCGGLHLPLVHPSSGSGLAASPQLLRAGLVTIGDDDDHDAAIVGFWHVKFVVGSGSSVQEIDAGYSQWHADGTEIMNSGGRPPVTTSFCLGVWKQVGYRQYKLNHFAASWDPTPATNAPDGTLMGPAQIQEDVTVAPDGNHFSGTFTIDQYLENGNLAAHVAGNITGTRITVSTPHSSIF